MSQMEIRSITKKFGDMTALDNISLKLEENKIYGLLGRNGAGKTTLLNLITNRIFPTDGEILVDGENVIENERVLSKIYFMTENNYYPENMTVKQAFKWSSEFYPDFDSEYAADLCEKFSLNIKQKIKSLSTGYTSIFKMILALACNVPFVLLDEPVLGLDANHRDLFYKELLINYSEKPKTIVISTHLIEEAADIIEDVIIIKSGKLIVKEPVENVLSQGYAITGSVSAVDSFTNDKNVLGADTIGGLKCAYVLGSLIKAGIPDGLEVTKPDLQKLFIHLTNR
ncbi:ABC transporter ATP-binding protein [Ruminiclostridium cellulolyticum]|uniref:ABC transporter related n=1 Tax=Ruminiclostridium cellulolyticum (strain ATCC 35319 / DSM 5812 / JCM 6584 / H10) TaxID=394503 RepID=B8I6U4_RUMCH|nr:ABC transporter ATP-binding protein [Ruminiclostridium cellulolyticum]ACL76936.1 ABC transporter related [Ruminiclostridium cellulolyticum H10]